MAKIRKIEVPYTQIVNNVLYDNRLSYKAKGLFAYIQAKPDDWDFASDRIARESTDGRDSVRSGLKELEHAGYLVREKQSDGTFSFSLFLPKESKTKLDTSKEPPTGKTSDGKTHSGETQRRKSRRIINKDITNKEYITNKESAIVGDKSPTLPWHLDSNWITTMIKLVSEKFENRISEKFIANELKKFHFYWTEQSPGGKKMKFEKQKVFDPSRRFAVWMSRVAEKNMDKQLQNNKYQAGEV